MDMTIDNLYDEYLIHGMDDGDSDDEKYTVNYRDDSDDEEDDEDE